MSYKIFAGRGWSGLLLTAFLILLLSACGSDTTTPIANPTFAMPTPI